MEFLALLCRTGGFLVGTELNPNELAPSSAGQNTTCLYRVLTMVYNTQNYWVVGLCPSSVILETRKNNFSKTGSVSVLR
jgi:hypothetical protein